MAAEDVVLAGAGAARFVLRLPGTRVPVRLRVGGLHNVYNAVAAAAGAVAMDLPPEAVVAGLEATPPAWGRGEVVRVDGTDVVFGLFEDAVEGAVLVRTLLEEPEPFDLLLAVTASPDKPADLPFLGDVDVARLVERARTVVCGGDRASELALWLKYAGADLGGVVVDPSPASALRRALTDGQAGRLHVVGHPRALEALREQLAEAGRVARWWR